MADLIAETSRRLADLSPKSADSIRRHDKAVAGFSLEMERTLDGLKQHLFQHFWRHHKVNRTTSRARHILDEIFVRLMKESELLPPAHADAHAYADGKANGMAEAQRARRVADYLASMTDSEANMEYTRLFGPVAVMPSLV